MAGGAIAEAGDMSQVFDPRPFLEPKILALEGVEQRKSRWARGPAYFVAGKEFLHFHGRTEIDVRLTSRVIRLGLKHLTGDARARLRRGRSDWVALTLTTLDDAEFALEVITLAWKGNRKT